MLKPSYEHIYRCVMCRAARRYGMTQGYSQTQERVWLVCNAKCAGEGGHTLHEFDRSLPVIVEAKQMKIGV